MTVSNLKNPPKQQRKTSFVLISRKRKVSYTFWPNRRGTTLVCLHGLLDSAEGWGAFAKSAKQPVLAIDLPGFSRTSLPDSARIEAYAEMLSEALLRIPELKNKRFILIGHSLGGATASALLAYPEVAKRLRGVVLIAPAGYGKTPSAELFAAFNRKVKLPGGDSKNRHIPTLPLFPFTSQIVLNSNRLVRFSYSNWITNGQKITPEIESRLKKSMDRKNKRFTIKGLEVAVKVLARLSKNNFERAFFSETSKELDQTPMLIIWGEEDRLVAIEHAKQAKKCFPKSKLLRLRNIGHYPQAESPEKVIEAIKEISSALKQ